MSVASDALGAQSRTATQTATIPSRVLTGRSRLGRLTGIELAATGIYVPNILSRTPTWLSSVATAIG